MRNADAAGGLHAAPRRLVQHAPHLVLARAQPGEDRGIEVALAGHRRDGAHRRVEVALHLADEPAHLAIANAEVDVDHRPRREHRVLEPDRLREVRPLALDLDVVAAVEDRLVGKVDGDPSVVSDCVSRLSFLGPARGADRAVHDGSGERRAGGDDDERACLLRHAHDAPEEAVRVLARRGAAPAPRDRQ